MVNVDALLYGSATVAGLDVGEEEGPERVSSGSDGEDEAESDEDSDEEAAVHEAPSAPASPTKKKPQNRVRVFLRVRPLLQRELDSGVCVNVDKEGKRVKVFSGKSSIESSCDGVWAEMTTQAAIFEGLKDTTSSLLQGLNNTVLAYGQTGTGKTFTMLGGNYLNTADGVRLTESQEVEAAGSEYAGIIPRLMIQLFNEIGVMKRTAEQGIAVKVLVSYLEIYNEKVYDLLNPKQTRNARGDDKDLKRQRINLEVRDNHIPGLTMCAVTSAAEVMLLIRAGNRLRAVRHTNMNQHSSRSHAILQVTVQRSQGGRTVQSKMNLVDLAGSERWDVNDTSADRVAEMTSINQGLSALASVVAALQKGQQRNGRGDAKSHIPYRSSKITHVLMDSLGGNCKTTLIATLSPSLTSVEENISTVRFADRVRDIQNHAVAKERNDPGLVLEAKEAEIQRLRGLLNLVAGSDAVNIGHLKESLDAVSLELEKSRQELAEARRAVEQERQKRMAIESQLVMEQEQKMAQMMSFHTVKAQLAHAADNPATVAFDSSQNPSPKWQPIRPFVSGQTSPTGAGREAESFHLPPLPSHPPPASTAAGAEAATYHPPSANVTLVMNPHGALAQMVGNGAASAPAAESLPHPIMLAGPSSGPAVPQGVEDPATDVEVEPLFKLLTDDSPIVSPRTPTGAPQEQQPNLPSALSAPSVIITSSPQTATTGAAVPGPSLQQPPSGARAIDVPGGSTGHQAKDGTVGGPVTSAIPVPDVYLPQRPAVRQGAAAPAYFSSPSTRQDRGEQQEPRAQKELFAIGGILAEVTQIRSELRQLIQGQQGYRGSGQGQGQPYGSALSGQPWGGYRREQSNGDASSSQLSYGRNGKKAAAPVAPAAVRHAYGQYDHSPTARRHPRHSSSTAQPRDGSRRQALPSVPARGSNALRNGKGGAQGRAAPVSAPERTRSRDRNGSGKRSPGGGIHFPPVPVSAQHPSSTHNHPSGGQYDRYGRPKPEAKGTSPVKPKKSLPPPRVAGLAPGARSSVVPAGTGGGGRGGAAGQPSGGNIDVGTWIYIMGPRTNHVHATKMAELDSVAKFNLADQKSPAHLFI